MTAKPRPDGAVSVAIGPVPAIYVALSPRSRRHRDRRRDRWRRISGLKYRGDQFGRPEAEVRLLR